MHHARPRTGRARVKKQLLCCFNFRHFDSALPSVWALCFSSFDSLSMCRIQRTTMRRRETAGCAAIAAVELLVASCHLSSVVRFDFVSVFLFCVFRCSFRSSIFFHDCHFLHRMNNWAHSSRCACNPLSTRYRPKHFFALFLSAHSCLLHTGWCSIAAIFISKGNIFLCRYFLLLSSSRRPFSSPRSFFQVSALAIRRFSVSVSAASILYDVFIQFSSGRMYFILVYTYTWHAWEEHAGRWPCFSFVWARNSHAWLP